MYRLPRIRVNTGLLTPLITYSVPAPVTVRLVAVSDVAINVSLEVSVESRVEYSVGPASSVAAISNSVSSEAGAAPTNDVTAVSTCVERFTICALTAPEMDVTSDESDDTLALMELVSDDTSEFRVETATLTADPCADVTACSEVTDCPVADMMDSMDAVRSLVCNAMPDRLALTTVDSEPTWSSALVESAPTAEMRVLCRAPLDSMNTEPLL